MTTLFLLITGVCQSLNELGVVSVTKKWSGQNRTSRTACYGPGLNLAVADTVKRSATMKKALDITHEITKLVKYSPRRKSAFNNLKDEMSPGNPGVRVLCPTRWTVRADSMESIVCNYSVLQELWDEAVSFVRDSEVIAHIRGVAAQM